MAIKQGCRDSILAFDYLNISLRGDHEIIRRDERVLFGIEKAEIETWLSSLGYRVLENLDPAEIAARCLTGADGKLFGDIKKTMNFIKAAV
jgi:O-methyltransferase involved in polyketide biosynthesis